MWGMEFWHAVNRGVDGRDLFLDERDYLRFVHNLFEFNDQAPADANGGYYFKSMDVGRPYVARERDCLVDVHGWCLMKNHYHLLVSERTENGLSLFLQKLNGGYAKYFNERHGRIGTLFQGRTKKVHIAKHAHFLYILHYLHLNPLDYLAGAKKWRQRDEGSIRNFQDALSYLDTYRWSSYRDYVRKRNFPSLLTTTAFSGNGEDYARELRDYLRDAERIGRDLALE